MNARRRGRAMSCWGRRSLAQLARISGAARGIALLGTNRCWGRTGDVGRFRLGSGEEHNGSTLGLLNVLGAFSADCPQDGVQMVCRRQGHILEVTGPVFSEDVACVSALCGLF